MSTTSTGTTIRQRKFSNNPAMYENNESHSSNKLQSGGLEASGMINAGPKHHGKVLKLHVPLLFSILPEFLQRIISYFSCLSFLAPRWEQRYLILGGNFLFKFVDEKSSSPKGTPFDVEMIDANIESVGTSSANLPPNYNCVFTVSTLRKSHIYAVQDHQEGSTWIYSLKEAKQECITRRMGHANHVPYPQAWALYDTLGRDYIERKNRIRKRLEESQFKEMEMADGSPFPRPYHG